MPKQGWMGTAHFWILHLHDASFIKLGTHHEKFSHWSPSSAFNVWAMSYDVTQAPPLTHYPIVAIAAFSRVITCSPIQVHHWPSSTSSCFSNCLPAYLLSAIWPNLSYRVLNSPEALLSAWSPLNTGTQSECRKRHSRPSTIWFQSNLLALFSVISTTNSSVHTLLAVPTII